MSLLELDSFIPGKKNVILTTAGKWQLVMQQKYLLMKINKTVFSSTLLNILKKGKKKTTNKHLLVTA